LRFEIARHTVPRGGLRLGRPIGEDEIALAGCRRRPPKRAGTAVSMLARRPRSERELRRRLAQRRFEPGLIGQTVALLRERGLINDAAFARSWAESRDRSSPRGRRLIAAELRAHGVDGDEAAGAVAPLSEEDAAYRVAQKRLRALAGLDDRVLRDRLGALLRRRGFGWETVRATVQRCLRERGSERDAGTSETIE
jgi:regulatory protein